MDVVKGSGLPSRKDVLAEQKEDRLTQKLEFAMGKEQMRSGIAQRRIQLQENVANWNKIKDMKKRGDMFEEEIRDLKMAQVQIRQKAAQDSMGNPADYENLVTDIDKMIEKLLKEKIEGKKNLSFYQTTEEVTTPTGPMAPGPSQVPDTGLSSTQPASPFGRMRPMEPVAPDTTATGYSSGRIQYSKSSSKASEFDTLWDKYK
jgi:hypothetical protein